MNRFVALLGLSAALVLAGPALAQHAAPSRDDNVAQIPQTSPGSPWSFIGFGIATPTDPLWFVANSTPRAAQWVATCQPRRPTRPVLVIVSELLDQPIESDTELLAVAQDRHARIGERWIVSKHEETIVRHAGTRCARHALAARETRRPVTAQGRGQTNADAALPPRQRTVCVHPTEHASWWRLVSPSAVRAT